MIKLNSPFQNKNDFKITQGFGDNPEIYQRFGLPAHNGIDFSCKEGTKITACQSGIIINSENHPSYGNIVKIKHDDGYFTLYCHLQRNLVIKGENVKQGDIIGLSGNTGFSTGPHLHLGLQSMNEGTIPYNYYIDPTLGFIEAGKEKKTLKKK
jgi:murein DD-endopeptidase MepM/ murein hydrolase activator NlpD